MHCYTPCVQSYNCCASARTRRHVLLKQPGTGSSCCNFGRVRVRCCSKQADRVSTETAHLNRKNAVASRQSVLQSCSSTTAVLLASAGALRFVAPFTSHLLAQQNAEDVQALLHVWRAPSFTHVLTAIATAAAVTAVRQLLLSAWPAFSQATDTSNNQVLTSLTRADLIWLSALPALSEEALFRGGLIPAICPDWRGAVIAAAVFGVLHNSGGRNWAFALWASAVGLVYGLAFLETKDLWVTVAAHAMANYASATLWLQSLHTGHEE